MPWGPTAVALKFSDYVKAGDALTLTLDPGLKALRRMSVATYTDDPSKPPVTLQVDLQSLPDGTNYPANFATTPRWCQQARPGAAPSES